MATDVERLVVSLSADVRSYENTMRKLMGLTAADMKRIRTEAANAGGAASRAFEGAARGVENYGIAASKVAERLGMLGTASQGVQARIDVMFAGGDGARDRAADIAAYGAELDRLKSKFVPVFAMTQRYEAELAEIAQAERIGAISALEAADARQRAAQSFDNSAAHARSYADAAQVAGRQSGALAAQTSNLAAQFQDVAVQLQMGANPLTIAVQQGTQISSVLGGTGAAGAVQALGGAFASLISPVSLVTIGLIAAGGAAIQYFSGLLDDGEKSQDELKEQAALIKQVATEWGDAVPSLKAYADELDRAAKLSDLLAASQNRIEEIAKGFTDQFSAMSTELAAALDAMNIGDMSLTPQIFELQEAFQDLSERVDDGTAKASDFDRVQAALASLISSTGNPALEAFAARFAGVAGSAAGAADQIARVASEAARAASQLQTLHAAEAQSRVNYEASAAAGAGVVAEQERLNGLTREQLALENEIKRVKADVDRAGGIISTEDATRLATDTLAAEKRRADEGRARSGGGGGGRSGGGRPRADEEARKAEREREAVVKLIEELQFEQAMIGKTNEEREIANTLRRAGAAATAEQRAQIEAIIAATYAETTAFEGNAEALEALRDLSSDVLGGLVSDLIEGKSASEALSSALGNVAQTLLDAGIENIIGTIFNGAKGGAGGGIIGALGSLFGGFRAGGGPVQAGRAYVVGERRPELFVPGQSGHIVPSIPKGSMAPSGPSGLDIGVAVDVDQSGNIMPFVTQVSRREIAADRPRSVRESMAAVGRANRKTGHFLK